MHPRYFSASNRLAGTVASVERPRAVAVSGLALLMVAAGVAALAGSWVLPAADLAIWQVRLVGLASLLVVVGLGLWHRMNWARCAAIGMFAYVIYAQLNGRWLQSEVLGLFIDSLRGVHDAGAAPLASLGDGLPPASASAASLGLALCVALGWFITHLLSAPVRAEFLPPVAAPIKPNKRVKVST